MNTMNKYYTPDISEFYFGFEYEMKERFGDGTVKTQEEYDKAKWIERITGSQDSPYIERMLFGKNADNGLCGVRVKHLDSLDIESLGFEENPEFFVNKKGDQIWLEEGLVFIYEPSHGEQIFAGTIKNKSELKKLFKQLNINYE